MEYNDFQMIDGRLVENMAKEYSSNLKTKGFVFVNLQEENTAILKTKILNIANDIYEICYNFKHIFQKNLSFIKSLENLLNENIPLLTGKNIDLHRRKSQTYSLSIKSLFENLLLLIGSIFELFDIEKNEEIKNSLSRFLDFTRKFLLTFNIL